MSGGDTAASIRNAEASSGTRPVYMIGATTSIDQVISALTPSLLSSECGTARQSMPDSGLVFKAKVLERFQVVATWLDSSQASGARPLYIIGALRR